MPVLHYLFKIFLSRVWYGKEKSKFIFFICTSQPNAIDSNILACDGFPTDNIGSADVNLVEWLFLTGM